jgi:cysteine desulfuration protein SufE
LTLDEIRETFSFFDSWEDKYRFIIDLGKTLDQLPDADKTDDRLIRGCQSQVWLIADYDPKQDTISLKIDSDAHIVRGLAAIVLAAFNNRSPAQIKAQDIDALFDELQLLQHLSPTRGNGLRSMVARIQALAEEHGS